MKVGDVMTRGVEPISPEGTIQHPAVCMAEHDVGALLAGSQEGDILLRVVVEGL